jgi:flagellar capping protein FliD
MTNLNINGAGQIGAIDVRGMDLESALMAVQSNRANLLESQLKDQISSVQAKNDQISKLNQLLGSLNKAAANVPADAKAGDKVDFSANATEINAAAESAGVALPAELQMQKPSWEVKLVDGTRIEVDSAGKAEAESYKAKNWAFRSTDYSGKKGIVSITELKPEVKPTKGQVDGFIQQLKSQIDSLSNSQQMDMLRLQSLSNKRNEAFEIMTNFIKKMQDNRSSIVGNMR